MKTYIAIDTVKEAIKTPDADDKLLFDTLVRACAYIDTYCNRSPGGFLIKEYDEILNGTGTNLIFLENTPIQKITRLATINQPCMSIHNTDGDVGSRALVDVDKTGIHLTKIKNAVTTENDFLFTTYPTVQNMVDAISGIGNFWQATSMGGYGTSESKDIRPTQGAYGARIVTAYLFLHTFDIPSYRVKESNGEIYNPMGFPRGWANFRCSYSAGYSAFPEDLAQALIEICQILYFRKKLNPNLKSETLGEYSYTLGWMGQLSMTTQKTLGFYKKRPVRQFSLW